VTSIIDKRNADIGDDPGQLLARAYEAHFAQKPVLALELLESALAASPNDSATRFCLAQVLLSMGKYSEGFQAFESRFGLPGYPSPRRTYGSPEWGGQTLRGNTVFVYKEQGMGDVLHFLRYLKPLADEGARVVVQVHAPLVRVVETAHFVSYAVPMGAEPPPFEYCLPMMSVPAVLLKTGLLSSEVATAWNGPYLFAKKPSKPAWHKLLFSTGRRRPRVGLCWGGNPNHPGDKQRSLPGPDIVFLIGKLLPLPVDLFSVQDRRMAVPSVSELLQDGRPRSSTSFDVLEFAQYIASMDLIVTVDTMVAHLAGAMGKPVWVLLPPESDWRWGLSGSRTAWYPTMALFRRAEGGTWADVALSVHAKLQKAIVSMTRGTRYDEADDTFAPAIFEVSDENG
jgi:hypothetical protein